MFNNCIIGKANQLSSYMIFVCKKTSQEFLYHRVRWSLAAAKSMKQRVNSSCVMKFNRPYLEKCLQVKQQLLGPGAVIEVKSQIEISF
jgi:hypothetical protein